MTLSPLTRRTARPLAVVAAGTALAAVLTGCGDDSTAATDVAGAPSAQSAQSGGPNGGPGGGLPGTFGLIAAVNGDVLQVRGQGQSAGQTAVTVTDATTITDQAAGTLADVTTGVCVVVRTADGDVTGNADSAPTAVTAASVSVTAAADDGSCTGGFGGPGGGEPPSGMPTDLPSDLPSDFPTDGSGMPGGRPGGFGTVGEVTSVSDSGFVVEGRDGDVTVTVDGATTYTHQVAADASALTTGRCVRVEGDADSAGAVTATAIAVSDAVNDQCGR
ncbi:DUF5666 domain-containing protein [Nocardioides nitrophenolicus]|uniref:DUF5666 domain-containing protein n=1 Tax=Nocardioides nitrophenolicus TaxID=60489 RepID=UPI00195A3B14|nr:DUF5666 domain-containing protein [Nocardioides nitrophenolicus]MBM7519814.1 hypothetical protein [Nocardioides nitrophenolicus]